ncbi:MAG: tRNA uridine-5-carboxymethylaminomethyl(34) synthesis GTPase MnmE [Spirochaetaceae bacterium]|jgi:tRNA modification GTPase|nr:tRNA uridine-5-carboxymethylaminomethyl(34) synthesis GTPase MnmE [Spirochaetaceae bacterium]
MRTYGDTCPIAAQAAQGALSLVRISGGGSLELLAKVFSRPKALLDAPGNTIVHGWIVDSAPIDEVLVSIYRAPHSYTGEDSADISCHGGIAPAKTVLELLRKAGLSDALPGEFTFRAFMNGKIDLTRSESVMELVSSGTREGLERAIKRLSGALEKEILAIRDKLLEAVSVTELYLDYPEDEIDSAEEGTALFSCRQAAEDALQMLKKLSASYRRERLYQEGALAVIAGRPNAGKSSLFNALLNEDRSIVTEIPGTTRDWIEGSIALEGIPLRLADTAGLRSVSGADEAESRGIERSRNLAEEADIILYTVDGNEGLSEEDKVFLEKHNKKVILLWNKSDLKEPPEYIRKNFAPVNKNRPLLVVLSAKTGEGIPALCASVTSLLTVRDPYVLESMCGLGTQRQKDLTEKAAFLLEDAFFKADNEQPLDVTALLLREALNTIGEITGEVSSADILETMFSRFCLGK